MTTACHVYVILCSIKNGHLWTFVTFVQDEYLKASAKGLKNTLKKLSKNQINSKMCEDNQRSSLIIVP